MTRDALTAARSLAAMALFRGLPPTGLKAVAAAARICRLPKDVLIFNQGDGDVRTHAVVKGGVRIAQSGSDGAQVAVRAIPRSASSRTGTSCGLPMSIGPKES